MDKNRISQLHGVTKMFSRNVRFIDGLLNVKLVKGMCVRAADVHIKCVINAMISNTAARPVCDGVCVLLCV